MPGGDRTGPMGLGPMTGRATGYCAGSEVPGYANTIRGRGRGFGRGWGRGRGRRGGWFGYGFNEPEFTPQQEAEVLKQEAKAMQNEITFINQRISELESAAKKTK